MDTLASVLDVHRRRLRAARAAEAALRGAFWVSLALGAALLLARVAGRPLGPAFALGLTATSAALLGARELLRRFSRRDCAIELDRRLSLEERLSTALEGAGPMKELQAADAADALARAPLPAWRAPREAKMLAGSLLVLVVLSVAPGAELRGDAAAERLEAVLDAKAEQIEKLSPEFREVADALRDRRVEEALARIEGLRAALAEKAAAGGAGSAEAKKLEEALGDAALGVGAELSRGGRNVPALAPLAADVKLRRALDAAPPREDVGVAPELRSAALDKRDWDPRYDDVVLRYFGEKP